MINGMGAMAQFALQKICGAHVSLGSWAAVQKAAAEVRPPLLPFPAYVKFPSASRRGQLLSPTC